MSQKHQTNTNVKGPQIIQTNKAQSAKQLTQPQHFIANQHYQNANQQHQSANPHQPHPNANQQHPNSSQQHPNQQQIYNKNFDTRIHQQQQAALSGVSVNNPYSNYNKIPQNVQSYNQHVNLPNSKQSLKQQFFSMMPTAKLFRQSQVKRNSSKEIIAQHEVERDIWLENITYEDKLKALKDEYVKKYTAMAEKLKLAKEQYKLNNKLKESMEEKSVENKQIIDDNNDTTTRTTNQETNISTNTKRSTNKGNRESRRRTTTTTTKNPESNRSTNKAKEVVIDSANLGRNDYIIGKKLGEGAYGKVVIAKSDKFSYVAIKCLVKSSIVRSKSLLNGTKNEIMIMSNCNSPFIVKVLDTFQNSVYLFIVLQLIEGGELFDYLSNTNKVGFPESLAKFYAYQTVLAIEYLHNLDIMHRDIKPENILLKCNGYCLLTDFGFAKEVVSNTFTLLGTPDYIAPEVLKNIGYNKAADWWSIGILIYELCCGNAPFVDKDKNALFYKIQTNVPTYPQKFTTNLLHLLENMLQKDFLMRYGNLKDGANQIKQHAWFSNVHKHSMSIYNQTYREFNFSFVQCAVNIDDKWNRKGWNVKYNLQIGEEERAEKIVSDKHFIGF